MSVLTAFVAKLRKTAQGGPGLLPWSCRLTTGGVANSVASDRRYGVNDYDIVEVRISEVSRKKAPKKKKV
jgi:hypothetical protein